MNKNYFSYEGCVFDNETFNIKSNGKSFFSPIPIFYKPKIEKMLVPVENRHSVTG